MKKIKIFMQTILVASAIVIIKGCGTVGDEKVEILSFSNGIGIMKAKYPPVALSHANKYCMNLPDGLGVKDVQPSNPIFSTEYRFSCYYVIKDHGARPEYDNLNSSITFNQNRQDSNINNQSPSANSSIAIELAKEKCQQLGFKNPSEKFGNCVLHLSR